MHLHTQKSEQRKLIYKTLKAIILQYLIETIILHMISASGKVRVEKDEKELMSSFCEKSGFINELMITLMSVNYCVLIIQLSVAQETAVAYKVC